ncbi:hypothetical protein [Hymenobacter jeollabukensis]|uniref:Uncharacterized protein n=1 Tax=Hymenobacter jeollabukensis TaxID=2025313 RepID=A0A5R8WNE3_9BACT|nr:hypothetical protein [Hymenobacter jeollabukensis]TLM91090.1 hypothetical protein FDY95_15965 [Hymenobacter jeollabukensis]
MKQASRLALLALLAACRPDSPAAESGAVPAAAVPPAAPAATTPSASPTDTLHLPGGVVLELHPSSAAAFNKLPVSSLPEIFNDSTAEVQALATAQGRVRRQGLALLLQPAQGPAVRLSSTPPAAFTPQNDNAVRYQYWGSLPTAHQWVVQAWYWESAGVVLVDQRTGRHAELLGSPSVAPDGRLVLLSSPGLGGGEQPNALSLVEITAAGPRRLWQRFPTAWEPQEVRWIAPGRAVLKLLRAGKDGGVTAETPPAYAELTLPPLR